MPFQGAPQLEDAEPQGVALGWYPPAFPAPEADRKPGMESELISESKMDSETKMGSEAESEMGSELVADRKMFSAVA